KNIYKGWRSIMQNNKDFQKLRMNGREETPRNRGETEIRDPYDSVMGKRYLRDVLETMGEYADILKFAGGAFTLYPETELKEIIDITHEYDVKVSTGGFLESVIPQGIEAVDHYIEGCKRVGYDKSEMSSEYIKNPN